MIAPEYFNNHVSVEGEIIVKSVPNDAGFVLVWNPTTKKISRRTHAEIATDLGLVTASNEAFFNRNRIRSETISSVPVSLDAYLPQGGFISSYNTSSWGGSDRPINASYGGYIKFSDGNNDFNNLELYYNNGHNTPDTHRLWFRTKNNLGSTNWFEAYHSGNLNPDNFIQTTHPVNNITQTNINNWLPYKAYEDNRGIAPNHLGTQSFQYGFGSWNNNNNYPYADYLHFGGYQDGSGGNQNLIMFNKNGFGFRQYQSSPQNSNLYTDYIDYWHTGNFNQGYVDEWINKANEGIVSIPMLADYVKTSTNQQIGDLKTFTGAYTSWLLDGNSSTNAHGFLQSVQDSFLLGSLNDKNVVLYRNSIHKIVVANDYTQFIDRIQAPFASIVQNDLSPYGNYVGLESSSQDGNRIYLGGVADTVGSYIGQAKYVTSNQYQSNKSYASFIKFGNAGDIVFYGDVGLTTDTNYNPSEIAKIDNGGRLKINSVVVNGGNSNQFLKADGSLDSTSYVTSAQLGDYHNIDLTDGINNGSSTHINKSWFDYNWAATGKRGSVINFSGLYSNYSTELFGEYDNGGNNIGIRTKNGDTNTWNNTKWLWHTGNFNPSSKANALENATGVGFSAGVLPTLNGAEYPYMVFDNGIDYGIIPIATQGWVNNTFATKNELSDYVTIHTPQTIIANKNFAPTATLTLSGNDVNLIKSYTGTSGNEGIVSAWVHRHYSTFWRSGNRRGGNTQSLGYSIEYSEDDVTYTEKMRINPDGFLVLSGGGKVDPYGNLNLQQNTSGGSATGIWWNNKDDSGNRIAGIGALTTNGELDYVYLGWGSSPWDSGSNLAVSNNTIQYKNNVMWHAGNFNPDLYLKERGGYQTGAIAKTDFPLSITDYAGDPSTTGFQSYYGTSFHFKGPNSWYNRLDFPVNAEKLFLYQGINTTDMTLRGYIPILNGNVINWDSTNFNPSSKANALENAKGIGFSSGNYPTANGIEYPYLYFDNGSTTSYVALATQEFTNANYHKINHSGSLANQSDSHVNKTWFDYSWAGSGSPGSVINFSGLGGYYATELFGEYGNGGNRFGLRTRNGDAAQWNDPRWIWHSGNFNPSQYVTQSNLNSQLANYATLNGVQTFTNTISFSQSPVIPNGTINSHAVNLGQLYYNDRNFITDSRGAVRPPSFYDDRFAQWDFQYTDDTQVTGDAWQGVLTVAKWSNFDPSHRQEQILFTGENLKRRTAIDDDTWGPEKTIWDSGNFTPANFATASQLNDKVNRSGDTMTGALLIGNTNIGKQRVLHLAEPTLLDSYGFNFYTDTSTGLLTLHGLNNGSSNAVPILSANRGNNFVGINKENPASELDVNGYVASNGFIKNNSSDDYFLMGGGGQLTKYSKDDAFVNSHRDFPDGTLITTSIDYSQSQGDSFLLEIKGNMYGGGIPMDTKVQGYIYADTIINQSGYSTYSDLNTIVAMNINGNLCFWFPRLWYWQGFSVKVMATGGGDLTTINRVISIDNSPEPAGTKHVKIAIYTLSTQSWVNNQGFLTSANLNGYVTQSSLNTQLGNYATLNGVQTFNNTNTFNQSPVIPNGTLGNHAVNLNQLLDVAPPYHWNYVGQPAITNRRVLREMTWNNYGNGHTIFDISSGTTPWGASKSNVDAEQPWTPSYPTLVGGNGSETYGVRVDSARNSDNLGGISAGNYATQVWVNTNYIPRSHPVFNITQANINSWNAGTGGGSSHNHSNLPYLNNIDQYLGTGQGPQFGSIRLMDSLGYGLLALEEDFIGGEIGLVDLSNDRFYAGRINEYLKYGSSVNDFEGLNIHFDAKLLCIGREIGNDEDKVQLAGDLSVDTIDIYHNSRQLILNPLYNTNGDVRHSRNAHIYIVTGNTVSLPDKPILGQRIEIFNDSDNYIEVTHGNVGTMFKIPGFCKVTGIAANKGFRFDAEPIRTRQYDI
ncbi:MULTISPECIES: hypothetical protein [Chryseobacterium]|uniref:hypothetical protein n=1 Tax=Chryseobacterium TaxID=59732 RepID=UPI00195A1A45|nr:MULTISPECIES: hypothetical protein [Chryseobacterium]MBM7419458.1 hypothetical protein [Chryseobacterium sp. JUb44]MDH6209385.1 hypothetical protein [Chryseobacterium sp. BIGb0186]WSO12222.1 hypothetical protein VUJ64_09965 [Chryseobacterium scophthalmum]